VSVTIDWGALGLVSLVSFGAAIGVIVLFALGVSALAMPGGSAREARPPWAWPMAMLCFLTCTLVVAYGLYLIIAK
jgi:hypothetical protein